VTAATVGPHRSLAPVLARHPAPSSKNPLKADGKGKAGTISEVKVGDHVAVIGTGTGPLTAKRVLDRGAGTTK